MNTLSTTYSNVSSNQIAQRCCDILLSFVALIVLSPLFALIALWIKMDSKGPVIYSQMRVGKDNRVFRIYKFRSMFIGADAEGLLTTGNNDRRITRCGRFIRKYKIDELPQLLNVLKGEMSFVGPRPLVQEQVDMEDSAQQILQSVRPGITDYATIFYMDEGSILEHSADPQRTYREEIIPKKIALSLKYIENPSLYEYFKLIFLTILRILKLPF
ncbi:MAG: sugar transferase [Bacteroidales bacterium]|nr:sugar transferase [Bacteroidales bacterium]